MTTQHSTDNAVLKLNVGFLLKEGVGTTRVITFDEHDIATDDVALGFLQGDLELTRTAQGILVQGHLEAEVTDECARCLSPTAVPFTLEVAEHFVYPPDTATDGDPSVSEGGYIDLTPTVREDTILAIPMHVVCRPDCKGLCSQCGQNLNEATCDCDHSAIDPRFATLKALLDE